MNAYQDRLPQISGRLFLTDGGIETTLIFHEGFELPYFAAFDLMKDHRGRDALLKYFERYIEIARSSGHGFILESPTWRANRDWGDKLRYSESALADVNINAIQLMKQLRKTHATEQMPMVVSGCVGPRGDGYNPGVVMTPDDAQNYHAAQIRAFSAAGVDMIAAITMTNSNEAIGIARAARFAAVPVAISYTVETDGRLPTGESLHAAIEAVDIATGNAPVYYMINCAHPTHFADALAEAGASVQRIRGIRANASRRSHSELNEAPELDAGDPLELGRQYAELVRTYPQINILGGCCGTDHRHVQCISEALRR